MLVRQRLTELLGVEIGLRQRHGFDGQGQDRGDISEARIGFGQAPVLHALQQCPHLLHQPTLRERHRDHVLAELMLAVAVSLADQIEGGGDDLALKLGERGFRFAATTAASATALFFTLAECDVEGAHIQEEHGALDGLRTAAVVANDRVVRDQVAGLELPLFQEEGVPGRDLGKRGSAVSEDACCVLGSTVHRIDQSHITDPIVVRCSDFEIDLLDWGGGDVPAWSRELNRRLVVGEDVDGVLGRRRHEFAVFTCEFDRVEASPGNREAGDERAIFRRCEFLGRVPVQKKLTTRRDHCGVDLQLDYGPRKRCNVTAVFSSPRL